MGHSIFKQDTSFFFRGPAVFVYSHAGHGGPAGFVDSDVMLNVGGPAGFVGSHSGHGGPAGFVDSNDMLNVCTCRPVGFVDSDVDDRCVIPV